MTRTDFGRHFLVDFIGCDPDTISVLEITREIFLRAAQESKATIVGQSFHQFEPIGVSGVLLIAESHFSIHTWPENRFAGVDIFTCGDEMSKHPRQTLKIVMIPLEREGVTDFVPVTE